MTLYDTNLNYALQELLLYSYDFTPIRKKIFDLFMRVSPLVELQIIFSIIPPIKTSSLIQDNVKSFQKKEICVKIYEMIRNSLNSHLEKSLNRFPKLKQSSKIEIKNNTDRFSISIKIKNLKNFTPKLIFAIASHFNVNVLGYCDEVRAKISILKPKLHKPEVVLNTKLKRVRATDMRKFLTLDDKESVLEFLKQPEVKKILLSNFYPYGAKKSHIKTEITFDVLKERVIAQKRRRILLSNGVYKLLHDVITPYTSNEEFLKIISNNNILGFYSSVRTTKTQEIVTAIIDIDISRFLRTSYSILIIWKLIIAFTEDLIRNLTSSFQLPTPLVVFSGNRGIHLVYRLEKDCINADFNYLDFSELYILPSQKYLVKNKNSILHSKFTFMRTLMQAILLYTIKNFAIQKIPKLIRNQLGILNTTDLFKISLHSNNEIGILLDTTPNNSGVHRCFSIHPKSGLVSIPLNDPITKLIAKRFKEYNIVKKESNRKFVIDNIKRGIKASYFQFPPVITKEHIKYLLQPDTLLPYLSLIVRFSDRWITERSTMSMKYWLDIYKLNNFYDYIKSILLSINLNGKNIGSFYQKIVLILKRSSIRTKAFVMDILDDYFFKKASFYSIKARLDALRHLEFYYLLKSNELSLLNSEKFELVHKTPFDRKKFHQKFIHFFNITLVLLVGLSKNNLQIKSNIDLAIKKLYFRLELLLREVNLLRSSNRDNKNFHDQLKMVQIACMYNILIKFFRNLKPFLLLYS